MDNNLANRYLGSIIASYTHFNCKILNSDLIMIIFFPKITV